MSHKLNVLLANETSTRCYKPGVQHLVVGIVCSTLFAIMGGWSVYAAYYNVDGSFPHPKMHALVHGVFWSCCVLVGASTIAAYFCERLVVTTDSITQYGLVGRRQIFAADVRQIAWNGSPKSGSVTVRSPRSKITVHLGHFKSEERDQLIRFIREAFHSDIHQGWTHFFNQGLQVANPPQPSLRDGLICAIMFLSFGAVCIYLWAMGYDTIWQIIGASNLAAGFWYLWRCYRVCLRKPA